VDWILVRAHDRPFVPEWVSEISHTRLDLRAIAFDPQDNPVVRGMDRNHPGGSMRVVKLDAGSGKILADGYFGTLWDEPAAMAIRRLREGLHYGVDAVRSLPAGGARVVRSPRFDGPVALQVRIRHQSGREPSEGCVFHGAGDTRV